MHVLNHIVKVLFFCLCFKYYAVSLMPSFPAAFPPSIPKGFSLGNDVDFAKECAKVVHYYRFITEQIDRMFKLMHQAALCYR